MHTCSVVLTAFIIERMGIIGATHRTILGGAHFAAVHFY